MCTNTRIMKDRFGRLISTPCKYYCMECRNMRREEYTQRLIHEWETRNYIGSFITLTYNDDNLPRLLPEGSAVLGSWFKGTAPALESTLSRSDLSKFADNMQKKLRYYFGHSGKYILVGEYGDEEHRPHYHGIYLGLPTSERRMLYDTWNKGRIDIQPINHADIRYTLKYIDKQIYGVKQLYDYYGDYQPPFAHFSKALGVNWIENNLDRFDKNGVLHFTDKKAYYLPPYFRDKYNFIKSYKKYPDSVLKFARDHNIKDLKIAKEKRDYLIEQSLKHKELQKTQTYIDLPKEEYINAWYNFNQNQN